MTSNIRKPASQSLIGIKMFIIAVSLSGTLFGWAVLAAGQVRDALLNRNVSNTIVQPSNSVTSPSLQQQQPAVQQQQPAVQAQPTPALRQGSNQFRPSARSRSSR